MIFVTLIGEYGILSGVHGDRVNWPNSRWSWAWCGCSYHYNGVIMSAMVSQITSLKIVYSNACSGANQRKYQSSCVTGLCEGNSPMTGEFPAQRASNAENASIWWRHHGSATFRKHMELCLLKGWPLPKQPCGESAWLSQMVHQLLQQIRISKKNRIALFWQIRIRSGYSFVYFTTAQWHMQNLWADWIIRIIITVKKKEVFITSA